MRKVFPFYLFTLLACVLLFPENGQAQQPVLRKRAARTVVPQQSTKINPPPITDVPEPFLPENAPWMRILYRELDLSHEKNHVLYEKLFTCLYTRIDENRLSAYEYIDGKECFDEKHKINTDHIHTRLQLTENKINATHVRAFYLKEIWYFNPRSSALEIQFVALCPLLTVYNETGIAWRVPLCWIPYNEAAPELAGIRLPVSNTNNALLFTVDDFFRCRLFQSELVKTGNQLNRSLLQEYPSATARKAAQEQIERELAAFSNNL